MPSHLAISQLGIKTIHMAADHWNERDQKQNTKFLKNLSVPKSKTRNCFWVVVQILSFYNAKHVGGLESRHLISSFRRFIDSQTCSTQSFDKFWKNKLFLFDCKCFFRRSRQAPRCHKKFQVKYYSIILCLFVALFNECQ